MRLALSVFSILLLLLLFATLVLWVRSYRHYDFVFISTNRFVFVDRGLFGYREGTLDAVNGRIMVNDPAPIAVVPCFVVALLTAFFPSLWLIRRMRRRDLHRGFPLEPVDKRTDQSDGAENP